MYQLGALSFRFSMTQMGKKGMCNNESPKKLSEIAKPTRNRVGFGKKASNRIWVFFDTFKRYFTSILPFLKTFPNRSDHCIFLGSISWGSSKGSKRTLKAVHRVSLFAFATIHFSACFPPPPPRTESTI